MRTDSGRDRWPEVDVLRGVAAALMILSHVGVHPGSSAKLGPFNALVFLGSFAPVLFYFLTGLGHGLQSMVRPPGPFSRTLVKCVILFAADAFLWIKPGQWFGMDFLGFIGLSLLVVDILRRLRHSGTIALVMAGVAVLLRYVVDPLYQRGFASSAGLSPSYDVMASVALRSIPGFSYVLCPWIVYPLIGYSVGREASRHRDWVVGNRPRLALIALVPSVLFGASATFLAWRGMVLFRWGPMSASYFLLSLAVLCVLPTLAWLACLNGPLSWLSLSGERSFAVVPIHYFWLAVVASTLGPAISAASYGRNLLVVFVLSFGGSAIIPAASSALKRGSPGRLVAFKVAVTLGVVVGLLTFAMTRFRPEVELSLRCLAQLLLCLLLSLPSASAIAHGPAKNAGAMATINEAARPLG